jgi:eukaryotic-like serine/threonine-protein kinase
VSRYVTTGATAAGGIGAVVVYMDTNLDRKVAIKFVHPGGEHRRLLDELAALQRIRSKHVVQIFDVDFFDPGSRMGIIEEFIDGDSLHTVLGKTTTEGRFVRLLYQAATGIADIHALGIVHRDIKPSNVLVDHEGILKIIDFNLSRPENEAHTIGVVGTPGYAAPELHALGVVSFDVGVDVYALGVTAWALVHGKKLPKELALRPPQPDIWKATSGGFGVLPELDAELANLLDACLEVSPSDRPTAAQVARRAARLLLHGKHRAMFVGAAKPFELNASNPGVSLSDTRGSVIIEYDGLDFRATSVTGEVWANNIQLVTGATLPDCCVIALGGRQGGGRAAGISNGCGKVRGWEVEDRSFP